MRHPTLILALVLTLLPGVVFAQDDRAGAFAPAEPAGPYLTSIRPAEGPTDMRMTAHLTGDDLTSGGAITLTIGTIPLEEVVLENGSAITAVVPAGLGQGTYDVIMTSEFGYESSLRAAYTVTAAGTPAPPYITSYTPTQGLSGDTLCVEGERIEQGAMVFVGEVQAELVSQDTTSLCVLLPEVPNGVHNLRVQNPGGGADQIISALRIGGTAEEDCACSALRQPASGSTPGALLFIAGMLGAGFVRRRRK